MLGQSPHNGPCVSWPVDYIADKAPDHLKTSFETCHIEKAEQTI